MFATNVTSDIVAFSVVIVTFDVAKELKNKSNPTSGTSMIMVKAKVLIKGKLES